MATKQSWSMGANDYLDAGSVYVETYNETLADHITALHTILTDFVGKSAQGISDANNILYSGYYRAENGALHVPISGTGWYIYQVAMGSAANVAYATQIAVSISQSRQMFVRNRINGVWYPWLELAQRNNAYGDLNYTGETITLSPDAVSCANNTVTDIASVDLPKGVYVLEGIVRFPSNSTGLRKMSFSNTAATMGSAIDMDIRPAVSGDMTYCRVTTVREVTASSETWYMNGLQNSGSALSALGRLKAVRIA